VLPADLPANRQLTHAYATSGAAINVSLADEDGSYTNVATKAVTVSAPAEVLTVDAGADRTVNEGSTFIQTITFTDPTDTDPAGRLYTIDWGDGSTSSGRTHNAGTLDISHRYADDRATAYTVSVNIDDDGAQQASDSFQVTVNNVAPTLSLSGNGSTAEGSLYTLHIAASDPGTDSITQYSVDWGDGTPASLLSAAELAAASGNVSHTYADGSAARTITVEATDEDGTWSNTKAITVANVAPSVTLSGADAIDEGGSYTLTLAGVTDPGQDTPTSYTINWGDGNAEVVASLGSYSHTYADGNTTPTISVLVTDEDGAHANAGTKAITVNNVAPTLTLSGNASTPEGSLYALHIAHSDPGADTLHTYRIDWGDGSAVEVAQRRPAHHPRRQLQPHLRRRRPTTITVDHRRRRHLDHHQGRHRHQRRPDIDASGAATPRPASPTPSTSPTTSTPARTAAARRHHHQLGRRRKQHRQRRGQLHPHLHRRRHPTITVSLADEDGTYANVASLAVSVAPPTPTVAIAAQAAGSVRRAHLHPHHRLLRRRRQRRRRLDLQRHLERRRRANRHHRHPKLRTHPQRPDGDAALSATITVSDTSGTDSDVENLALTVTNVAPTATVRRRDHRRRQPYTLTVGPSPTRRRHPQRLHHRLGRRPQRQLHRRRMDRRRRQLHPHLRRRPGQRHDHRQHHRRRRQLHPRHPGRDDRNVAPTASVSAPRPRRRQPLHPHRRPDHRPRRRHPQPTPSPGATASPTASPPPNGPPPPAASPTPTPTARATPPSPSAPPTKTAASPSAPRP
jgi:hypothetical protein